MTTDLALRASTDLHTLTPASTPGDITAIVQDILGGGLAGIFERMEWAEEEIEKARARHPQHTNRLYHSFMLLTPTHERMETEFVYRAHCRELLDRVAAGEDTRPGTAAEICCAMLKVSLATPITSAASGLYMRMWQTAGFPEVDEFTQASHHHEALEKTVIDDHETFARRKLAVADRRLGNIDCPGRHHGEEVNCPYARADQLALAV